MYAKVTTYNIGTRRKSFTIGLKQRSNGKGARLHNLCGLFAVSFSLEITKGVRGECLGGDRIGKRRGSMPPFLRSRRKMVVRLQAKRRTASKLGVNPWPASAPSTGSCQTNNTIIIILFRGFFLSLRFLSYARPCKFENFVFFTEIRNSV